MPIPQKVIKFIGNQKYEEVKHKTVFTAYDKAATLKVPQKMVGKTLVVRLDSGLGLALIPANRNLDKNKLKKAAGAKKADFASETIIRNRLKGVKLGSIPPFGAIWKIPTFVDNSLLKSPKVIVNSGDYAFSLKISGAGLKKLVPDLVKGSFGKAR